MQAKKLDGCPPNSFLTFFICLQCSDNDFEGGDVSRDDEVMYQEFCMSQGARVT